MSTNPQTPTFLETQNEPKITFKWLMFLLTMFMVSLLMLYFINFHEGWGDKSDFGAFGDYFGGVLNPIFGFSTVGLLIWSLKMQRDELSLSRRELTLTRQELAKTKEETALSRKALQEQVEHLQKEAKLNELRGVLGVQLGIINECLAAPVHIGNGHQITYRAILNNESIVQNRYQQLSDLFHSRIKNPVQKIGKKLEIQIIQYACLCLEYSKESNSQSYALPYLTDALSLLDSFNDFQSRDSLKDLMKDIGARITEGRVLATSPSESH
ncbi:hypothetical protein LFREDSHE_22750 [Shewanella baltica]